MTKVLDNNNKNNLFTYIAPFNIYRMIKGALQLKKTKAAFTRQTKVGKLVLANSSWPV